MRRSLLLIMLLFACCFCLNAENFRTIIAGSAVVSRENPEGSVFSLSYIDSVLIELHEDTRFFRGVEIELAVPQQYLKYRGSLAIALYSNLSDPAETGVADITAKQLSIEPIPNKIQTVYQIPILRNHGIKTSPYASMPAGVVLSSAFPMLVRIMPVMKGISEELERMKFQLTVKPIFNELGIARLIVHYPKMLQGKPFTVIIDDTVIHNLSEELLLKEGEHYLVLTSDDYRNERKRFIIERSKVIDLVINLQDPTPLVIFEVPENTQVYFDDTEVHDIKKPLLTEPGEHQIRFRVGDYSIIKPLSIQKGKTYRVNLMIDVNITETD